VDPKLIGLLDTDPDPYSVFTEPGPHKDPSYSSKILT
jgi:hypothetical protein